MKMTREQMVRYWASEPKIKPCEPGCIRINLTDIPFPDLTNLTPTERDIMRDVIRKHPEYLQDVVVFGEGVGSAVIQ
jgi:hypothetical protein